MTTAQILVTDVTSKSGTNKNNKPYTKYAVKDAAGVYYGTFDHELGRSLNDYKDKQAEIDFEVDGNFKNLTGIRPIAQARPSENGTGATSDMTKEDWEIKERRMLRTAIYKSFLEGEIGKYVSAMSAVGKDKAPTTAELAVFLDGFAGELIARAEKTIWGAAQQAAGKDDDDIPFNKTSMDNGA